MSEEARAVNVKESERLTSQLLSALALGKIPEALRDSEALWEGYKEHFAVLPDAVLALCYNHLLAALESLKGQQSAFLAVRLGECFTQLHASSPLTEEVARRVLTLLSAPVEGLSEELSWALREQALRFADAPDPFCAPHLRLEDAPAADTLAQLSAADAGLALYLIVAHAPRPAELKGWLAGVDREHRRSALAPPQVQSALAQVAQGHYSEASLYPTLLSAFEWAVGAAPALAFEWLAGLLLWERDPAVLRQLQNQLRRPLEHRIELTVQLYTRQAALLLDERGGERLGLKFLGEAATLAEALIGEVRARLAAGRTLIDLETDARLSLVLSDIYRALGDDRPALDLLEQPLVEARRASLSQPLLAPRVMRAAAGHLERIGLLGQAQRLYVLAFRATHLEFLGDDQLSAPLDALLSYLQGGVSPDLALEALYAMTDHYRLWLLERQLQQPEGVNPEPWRRALRWLSGQLEAARALFPYRRYLEAQLYIALTSCLALDPEAPPRASSFARALELKSAVALCELHALRLEALRARPGGGRASGEREEGGRAARALRRAEEHRRALNEAQRGGQGSVLRGVAIAYLCECARALDALQEEGGRDRERASQLEADVVEVAMLASRGPLNHLSGPLDLLIPPCPLSEVEAAQDACARHGFARAAYHLAHALRHITQRTFVHASSPELLHELRELHAEGFYRRWVLGQALDEAHYQRYDLLLRRDDAPRASAVELAPYSVLLEYKSFQGWLLACAVRHDGQITALRLSVTEGELTALVAELNEALSSRDPRDEARADERAARLYALLVAPLEEALKDAHRLHLASDGPLDLLPFCALRDAAGVYLVQRFELLRVWVTGDAGARPRAPQGSGASRGVVCASLSARGEGLAYALSARGGDERSFALLCLSPHELLQPEHRARHDVRGAQWLCLSLEAAGGALSLGPDAPARSPRCLNGLLCDLDVDCLALIEPVPATEAGGALCGALSAVRVGALLMHWESHLCDRWMVELIAKTTAGQRAIAYMCALTELRRQAIREGRHPREWAAMELYVPDPVWPLGAPRR